ncbi:MAG: hypothetical protein ACRDTT_12840, partial [Pseudonocardiaceae bacterium]
TLFTVNAKDALEITPAAQLTNSRSLGDAEAIIREMTGVSEIRYETDKVIYLRNRCTHFPTSDDLPQIGRQAQSAHDNGADYISLRRLSELFGAATLDAFTALSALLKAQRPDCYEPSLYRTH